MIILKAENISKQYRLGLIGTGTLSHDLNRLWYKVRGKEDPYLKIGEVNNRSSKEKADYVWALNDINFEVKQGEVLGIIGKNGAGKSTLLKILSRVTLPTTGVIKTKGRIASLLEVGTGFHPELTGRENVFLNGAILGMTKTEIAAKLDEIVEFSGCEMYIDTPVKRYSSGMKVRLAFAVAAHLEPDILVVDEVLAVGDAEFQKKAIGKMQDISKEGGRTVLFVSHNMASVKSLCTRGIVLENGTTVFDGDIDECINFYLSSSRYDNLKTSIEYEIDSKKEFQIKSCKIIDSKGEVFKEGVIKTTDPFFIEINYVFKKSIPKCHLTLIIKDISENVVIFFDRSDFYNEYFVAEEGEYKVKLKIQNPLLKPDEYLVTVGLADQYSGTNDHKFDILKFQVEDVSSIRSNRAGNIFLPLKWEMIKHEK